MNSRQSPHPHAAKVGKLVQVARELRQGEAFSITRLTTLKGLCADSAAATRFALHLAERTHQRIVKFWRHELGV